MELFMDNRPIGVFDSGLGGLTSVKELAKVIPGESIVYFGDTGRVPYGTRSDDTIIKYVRQDIRFLLTHDIKAILIACGTASSVALEIVKNEFDIPIMGVVDSTVSRAVTLSKTGNIGVLGTPGTIRSGVYQQKINSLSPKANVFCKACPLFVPIVENGHFSHNDPIAKLVVEEYLKDIKLLNIDTLILGCTHYPLLSEAIQKYMGNEVKLIDSGKEAADCLHTQLMRTDSLSSDIAGTKTIYVSDSVDNFSSLASMFLGSELTGKVDKIDIEKY
jgi:glutamate racemase